MTLRALANRRAMGPVLGALVLVTSLVGCLQKELAPLIPCTVSGVAQRVNVTNVDKVDLLLVIDDSGSMKEEQAKLQTQLPHVISVLASGDSNGDDMEDFPPVKSLRVGVLTVNLGTGSFTNPKCTATGDDGNLITRTGDVAGSPPPGCGANGYGMGQKFVEYEPETASETAAEFADRVACVAVVGSGGCGFEQQLESPLKALTPSTSDITFAGSTLGHGEANAFLREDSLLAILLITDEEDCSAEDYDIFDQKSKTYPLPNGDVAYHNVHCYKDALEKLGVTWDKDPLYAPQRYIDGFLALRPENPGLLVFGAITGVPLDFAGEDFTSVLKEDSMQYNAIKKPPQTIYELAPSCTAGADGDAAPPRRILQVAQGLSAAGAGVAVRSICAEDFAPALDAIIRKIADALGGACLPRALNPDSNGKVNCDVVEVLPEGKTCADLENVGRKFLRKEKGREVCQIAQLPATPTGQADPDGQGWFYEFDADPSGPNGGGGEPTDLEKRCDQGSQRISFIDSAEPDTGSQLRLECLQSVQEGDPTDNIIGGFCTPEDVDDCPLGDVVNGKPCPTAAELGCSSDNDNCKLICDPKSRTWQKPCDDDSDCNPFVCDTTTRKGADMGEPAICVNPTCG